MQPDLKILITVDEISYKREDENPRPGPHPIAWYHKFDGGRAFYTGLGHTSESYAEPLFLEHLYGGIMYSGWLMPPAGLQLPGISIRFF